MPFVVERVTDRHGLDEAWQLRFAVFCDEQGVPRSEEIDEFDTDSTTVHVVLRDRGTNVVVGTGRLLPTSTAGVVHIGRVAVAASARGHRVGALVMDALETIALDECGIQHPAGRRVEIHLSAQTQAEGFYTRLGYVVAGPVYLDAGIDHRDAVKVITR